MTTLRTIIAILAVALAVSACGAEGAATPGATPPAGTPVSAPWPAAPTASASVPAPANTPGPLSPSALKIKEAIERSKGVTRGRFSMVFVTGETQNGTYSESPYMDAQGELDGAVNHFLFKGGVLNQAFGNAETVEMVTDGKGKTFVRGAQILPSMDPKAWYYTESGTADPPLTVTDVLDFTDADTDWPTAIDAGREQLDGLACEVHAWNPSESAVSACSPPESSDKPWSRRPGRRASHTRTCSARSPHGSAGSSWSPVLWPGSRCSRGPSTAAVSGSSCWIRASSCARWCGPRVTKPA